MDWTMHVSALFVLAGTVVGIVGSLAVQWIIQRNENARHLRKIAYDAAFMEWERMREFVFREIDRADKVQSAGEDIQRKRLPMPILDDYIIHHVSLADALTGMKPVKAESPEIIDIVLRLQRRNKEVFAAREAFRNSANP